MHHVKKLLETVGIDPDRVHFYNLSAAQGPRWAEICSEFTERINKLGPSPIWLALKKKQAASQTEGQPA